jgi:ParB family transcriptional regulator, chromosome partitioning protein
MQIKLTLQSHGLEPKQVKDACISNLKTQAEKVKEPQYVKPFDLNGRLYLCFAVMHDPHGDDKYHFLPLLTPAEFKTRHPGVKTKLVPHGKPGAFYLGTRVHHAGIEYIIGDGGDNAVLLYDRPVIETKKPSLSKAAKLAKDLGGNMTASIQGGDDCTVQSPADAQFRHRQRDNSAARILITRIQPDPQQPRKLFTPEDDAELAASLKAHGQLQPIVVRWDAVEQDYIIVSGERRYRAAKRIGLPDLKCIVWEFAPGGDAGNIRELQLVENLQRVEMEPMEQANAFRELMNLRGWNAKQLAESLSIHPAAITRALALLKLPETVREEVRKGAITPAVAYEVSKAPVDQQKELAQEVVKKKLTRDQVVSKVRGTSPADPRVTIEKCTIKDRKTAAVKPKPDGESDAYQFASEPAGIRHELRRMRTERARIDGIVKEYETRMARLVYDGKAEPLKEAEPMAWHFDATDGVKVSLLQGSRSIFGLLSVSKALREVLAKVEEEISLEMNTRKAG